MCAITFLKACTLSRISSARLTFYIQNCFYSKLLKKKKFSRVPNLKKLYLQIFKYHIEKKYASIIFEVKRQKKMFRRKKHFDCKSPMKWPIYILHDALSKFPLYWCHFLIEKASTSPKWIVIPTFLEHWLSKPVPLCIFLKKEPILVPRVKVFCFLVEQYGSSI